MAILKAIDAKSCYHNDDICNFGGIYLNRVLLALAVDYTEAFNYYCQKFPDQVKNAAYKLKHFHEDSFSLEGKPISRVQARLKFWDLCDDKKVRSDTLDREIMSALFSNCTTLTECLKQYEYIDKYINPEHSSSFFCKGIGLCADNARDLFAVASQRFCEVINQLQSSAERVQACDKLLKHHIFSEQYFKFRYKPQAIMKKIADIRNAEGLVNSSKLEKKI